MSDGGVSRSGMSCATTASSAKPFILEYKDRDAGEGVLRQLDASGSEIENSVVLPQNEHADWKLQQDLFITCPKPL